MWRFKGLWYGICQLGKTAASAKYLYCRISIGSARCSLVWHTSGEAANIVWASRSSVPTFIDHILYKSEDLEVSERNPGLLGVCSREFEKWWLRSFVMCFYNFQHSLVNMCHVPWSNMIKRLDKICISKRGVCSWKQTVKENSNILYRPIDF